MPILFKPCPWCHEATLQGRLHDRCANKILVDYLRLDQVNATYAQSMHEYYTENNEMKPALKTAVGLLEEIRPHLNRGRKARQIAGRIRVFLEGQ